MALLLIPSKEGGYLRALSEMVQAVASGNWYQAWVAIAPYVIVVVVLAALYCVVPRDSETSPRSRFLPAFRKRRRR